MVTVIRFSFDSYLPSMPAIAKYFAVSSAHVQLTLTLYMFGFGGSQFIYGPLSEYYGRKKVLLFGFLLFVFGGFLCLITPNLNFLIVARLISGLGAGATSILAKAIICDLYADDKPSIVKALATLTSSLVVSLFVAPVIGGYIQHYLSWRYNFFISFTYAALMLFIIAILLPETAKLPNARTSLSLRSVCLNYKKPLKNSDTIAYISCSTLAYSGLFTYFQLSPFIFINSLGKPAYIFGLLTLIVAMSYIIGGFITSYYVKKINIQTFLNIGIILMLLSGVLMLIINTIFHLSILSIIVPTIIYIIGSRITIPLSTAEVFTLNQGLSGYISALISGIQMLGASIVSFIISNIHAISSFKLAALFIAIGIISFFIKLHIEPNIKK